MRRLNLSKRSLENYMNLPFRVMVHADEWDGKPCFIAFHPDLPGCKAPGWTWEEAVKNLVGARRDYVTALLEAGIDVPTPPPVPGSSWNLESVAAREIRAVRPDAKPKALTNVQELAAA